MSNYRRLISYIYAYEGGVKGKNIGFAKLEARNGQCKISVNVKKVYVGSSDMGVYLLAGSSEIFLGKIFIRSGAGEFRTTVTVTDVEHSGIHMDSCYGLTIHDVEGGGWQSYTTIWEDAVAHAAEIELEGVTSENHRQQGGGSAVEKNPDQKEQPAGQPEAQKDAVGPDESPATETRPAEGQEDTVINQEAQPIEIRPDTSLIDRGTVPEKDNLTKTGAALSGEAETDGQPGAVPRGAEPEENLFEEIPWPEDEAESTIPAGQEPSPEPILRRQEAARPLASYPPVQSVITTPPRSQNVVPITQFASSVIYRQTESSSQGQIPPETVVPPSDEAAPLRTSQAQRLFHPGMAGHRLTGRPVNPIPVNIQTENEKMSPRNPEDSGADRPAQPHPDLQAPTRRPDTVGLTPNSQAAINQVPLPEAPTEALEDPDGMDREKSHQELWEELRRIYPKILAFDYENGCEILSVKPQDIGLLPRETWVYGNNSFLLHGYYNYRYLILVRLNNPQGEPRYLLGIPGNYYSNEKHMASMFGFPHFVLAKNQPVENGRFGYWYTDIQLGHS